MSAVYIISYEHLGVKVGEESQKTLFFTDKGKFLEKYFKLKDEWYAGDLRTFKTSEITEVFLDELLRDL